jgi:hypothetical protein
VLKEIGKAGNSDGDVGVTSAVVLAVALDDA